MATAATVDSSPVTAHKALESFILVALGRLSERYLVWKQAEINDYVLSSGRVRDFSETRAFASIVYVQRGQDQEQITGRARYSTTITYRE